MTDFNDNLDDLITTEEETPIAETPAPDEDEPKETTENTPDATKASTESEAGSQPSTETDEKPRTNDTVPLATFMDLKHSTRELREQNLQLQDRLDRVEQRAAQPPQEDEDDDEPLTRADLRRIEAERLQSQQQQTEQQRTQRVRSALLLAEPAQERMLMIGERYLSATDRQTIANSDNVLETATTLAKARINAFGSEDEVAWVDKMSAQQRRATQPKQATSQSKQKSGSSQQTDEGSEYAPTRDDLASGARGVLDHMFG